MPLWRSYAKIPVIVLAFVALQMLGRACGPASHTDNPDHNARFHHAVP